ncbi:hypothetical protein K2W90_02770 [Candidatus Babeliales bacterium]|nr:hypothetical protein [Candidatus Babeliales bacterium]
MNKKIVLFVLCFTGTGHQLIGMQALHDSLVVLKTKLSTLAIRLAKIGARLPIRFDGEDLRTNQTALYSTNHPAPENQLDPNNCQTVGGPFTYYNARPLEDDVFLKICKAGDFHEDMGWGCAWRASLNVLNKVREWLEKKHGIVAIKIKTDAIRKRQTNMCDINKWGNYPYGKWIEPSDNAELFLSFIEKWYKPEDQTKIKGLLNFRGRLYLTDPTQKDAYVSSLVGKQEARSTLPKLKEYLGLAPENGVKETLNAFYSAVYPAQNVPVAEFPAFNEETNPFPLNVDDGTLARNIYGSHQQAGVISHLFIGEVHVWPGQTPWQRSGWEPIGDIFNTNIMIFEVYLR